MFFDRHARSRRLNQLRGNIFLSFFFIYNSQLFRPARLDFAPKFEAWRWKCRVKIFKYKMFEFIKAEHQKYLQEIGGKPILLIIFF